MEASADSSKQRALAHPAFVSEEGPKFLDVSISVFHSEQCTEFLRL
jgi:hypothetical protein